MNSKFLELVQDIINKAKDSNICIYGNNGSGKTTLLKEVCKALKKCNLC